MFFSREKRHGLLQFDGVKLLLGVSFLAIGGEEIAFGKELSIESSIDGTPSELRQLYNRSALLDAKINELERRLAESQKAVIGSAGKEVVDYRLELTPSADEQDKKEMLVSHVRMALNGRPFVYTQSAILVSAENPLPLFMGMITEGQHTVRLQFQMAPFSKDVLSGSKTSWRTVDKVVQLNVDSAAGKKQSFAIAFGETAAAKSGPVRSEDSEKKIDESLPLVLEKQKEMK
jgi:hypothetical protein